MTVALLGEDVNRVEDDIDSLQIETGVLTIDLEGNIQRLLSLKSSVIASFDARSQSYDVDIALMLPFRWKFDLNRSNYKTNFN